MVESKNSACRPLSVTRTFAPATGRPAESTRRPTTVVKGSRTTTSETGEDIVRVPCASTIAARSVISPTLAGMVTVNRYGADASTAITAPFTSNSATPRVFPAASRTTSIVCPSKTVAPEAGAAIASCGTRSAAAAASMLIVVATAGADGVVGTIDCVAVFRTTKNGLTTSPMNRRKAVVSFRFVVFSTANGALVAFPTNSFGSVVSRRLLVFSTANGALVACPMNSFGSAVSRTLLVFSTTNGALVACPTNSAGSVVSRRIVFSTANGALAACPTNSAGSVVSRTVLVFSTANGALVACPMNSAGSVVSRTVLVFSTANGALVACPTNSAGSVVSR